MKSLNKKFYIKFYPKDKRFKRKGFLISVNRLPYYLGQSNADTIISELQTSLEDKWIRKFRATGELHIYGTK